MRIWFKRTANMHEEINALMLSTIDDERYRFVHGGDWINTRKQNESPGWSEDAVLVIVDERVAGFIEWDISRNHQKITGLCCALRPEFLDQGVGLLMLVGWLRYAMETRRFRKIEFSCHTANTRAERIYRNVVDVGGRYVGERERACLLRDGQYYDLRLYELLRERYKPTTFFQRLAKRMGTLVVE